MCARHSALCFYIPHTQWKKKGRNAGFENLELTVPRDQYTERYVATHCISQLTKWCLFVQKKKNESMKPMTATYQHESMTQIGYFLFYFLNTLFYVTLMYHLVSICTKIQRGIRFCTFFCQNRKFFSHFL